MAAKKRSKKQSLPEFRAWLEGVEELQPDGWAPNAVQWKLIRAKIDGIKEEVIVNNTQQPVPNNPYNQPAQGIPPSGMIPPAPQLESSIPSGPVSVTPTANPMFNPQDGKTRTPDIDTSDGNVSSSFA